MRLEAGARLGPYEIQSLIGAGGMGEVYKARDTRLNRAVAIKLLLAEVADRPDRRQRFQAEARAISSLSHPHICTLFDVGEQDGHAFLVMEYLEGETLDDRLTRGPLPAKDVVRYAVEVASALDHAHREHIVHRDLKPSNVMLTSSGAKLLDFGLARRPAIEAAPTMTTLSFDQKKLTAEGTILGTWQYMAPEQLEGRDADARTDVFALGSLMFEMATGRKAFEGSSQASLIASILTTQPPPISATRPDAALAPALDHVVERCLAKNPDDRWQTARDVKLELDWIAGGSSQTARMPLVRSRRTRRELVAWMVAWTVALVAIAGVAAVTLMRPRAPSQEATRFIVAPPSGASIGVSEQRARLALSPDGRQLAFAARSAGRQQIWVRSLASLESRPLAGTDGAISPFWSPDSKYIGFFVPGTGELKKIDIAGGPSRTICTARIESLPEWGADGTILFSIFLDGVFRVSAEGGTPRRVTSVNKAARELNHFWPTFLPDGRHFLYVLTAQETETTKQLPALYVAALDGSDKQPLTRIRSRAVYALPGYLLFVEEGALLAQPFDVASLRLTGEATRIADGVGFFRTLGNGNFAVSATGAIAYLGSSDLYRMAWYDRHGNETDTGWDKQAYGGPRFAPDGQHVAIEVTDPRNGTADIWVYDLARNVPARFTTDRESDRVPLWSPDGRRILYTAERGGSPNLFTKPFEGPGEIEPMVVYHGPIFGDDWSPDGQSILYTINTVQTGFDLWIKPVSSDGGNGKERPILNSQFDEFGGRFSPDSAWIAFESNEANARSEVYVAPVRQPERRKQISIGGGTSPRWRQDGRELFYVSGDNRSIMSVVMESMSPFKAALPSRLFSVGGEPVFTERGALSAAYDVTPDGQRFLVSLPFGEPASSRITVVLNWMAALKP